MYFCTKDIDKTRNMVMKKAYYDSPLGGITLASEGTALAGLWFDGQKHHAYVVDQDEEMCPELPIFQETCRWLDSYFRGKNPNFTPPLEMRGSEFRRRVWKALLEIPYGHTVSYGVIARRIGCKSAQAVGGAVGHNGIGIIIPCHRVIGADGSLTGYAAGLDRKAKLLALEASSCNSSNL